ncbi:carboxypeptidase-like regulatory domain-containing protein [Formosa sp. A9]|uniref:carboxypeptidase-like regulatory domain-containing protein n=1 Tax=Formosa sp. A9 TaxID=3442641 RepID=UPI003EBEABE8
MKINFAIVCLCLFTPLTHQCQTLLQAKIIDSTTQSPIPFATVSYNNISGVISNENGDFQLHLKTTPTQSDSLFFSCLGYEPKTIAALQFTDSLVVLATKSIALNEVMLFNKNYTVEEIIDKVKEQLEKNYTTNYTKSTLFFRESYYTSLIKKEVTIKTSTIPEFNQQFTDSLLNDLPNNSDNFTEILGTLYKNNSAEPEDIDTKLDIIKASHLYDKDNEITANAYEEKFNSIIKKRIKRDSYFKIKSGIFGTKEDMDSTIFADDATKKTDAYLAQQKQLEEDKKKNFLKYRKQTISNIDKHNFLSEDSDVNIIHKANRYQFQLLNYTHINDQYVYKIAFEPKRGEDYKGVLYVNTDDFAVIRLEYTNVNPIKTFKLLGISLNVFLKKGTLLYAKNSNNTYSLKYAEIESAQKAGVDRPLKIIEKNKHVKGRRKQNEVSADINFQISNRSKKEMVVFETETINPNTFEDFKEEAQVNPTYLPAYDSEFWKGYNIIEPNQAIKDFKSLDIE